MKLTGKHAAFLALLVFVLGSLSGVAADAAKMETEGEAIVKDLLSRRPPEAITNTGVLKLRLPRSKRAELRVEQRIVPSASQWQDTYTAINTNGQKIGVLAITHADQKPVQYRLQLFTGDSPTTQELSGPGAMIPFAGTDFWLADLGLEFMHWPTQRLLKKELRRGESCYVLESINPATSAAGYVRVVSWIDIDTGGIVHADAYDAAKKLIKEFEPKDFQKVHGQYQLKSMEIRNEQFDTRTLMIFDLDVK